MKTFEIDGKKINFAEKEDGENPSFPLDGVNVTLDSREKFFNIVEMCNDFDGVDTLYASSRILKEEVIERYDLKKLYRNFSFEKKIGMFVFEYQEDIPLSKLDSYIENAKTKFNLNSIYTTYIEKGVGIRDAEEALKIELSVINPSFIMVFMKEDKVKEWTKEHLRFFEVKYT